MYTVSGTGPNAATADDFAGGAFPTGTVTFGPNETSQFITFDVAADSIAEFDENFVVTLSNAQNSDPNLDTLEINTETASGLILNDDTSELAISDVFLQETQFGNTTATFTVSIANGVTAAEDLTFDFTTVAGTATAGIDFDALSGTATIDAGEISVDIMVTVFGDTEVELDETFTLEITNPTFADDEGIDGEPLTGGPGADGLDTTGVAQVEITDAIGEAIINNDDAVVEFVVAESFQAESGGPTGPQLFVRGDLTDVPVDQRFVTLQTVSGSAIRGLDYFFGVGDNDDPVRFQVPAEDYSDGMAFDLTLYDINGVLSSVSNDPAVLQIQDDNLIEGEEGIVIDIEGQGNVFTVAEAVVEPGVNDPNGVNLNTTHRIVDNDFATVSIVPVDVSEEGGTQQFAVKLTTTNGATLAPTIDGVSPGVSITADVVNQLADGTASASDFTYVTQDITFSPEAGDGDMVMLDVTPTSDITAEDDETINFEFANTNAGFLNNADSQVTFDEGDVTIIDDDGAKVALDVASVTVDEDAGTITLDVSLSLAVQGGFKVSYILTDGLANGGATLDFTDASGGELMFMGDADEIQQISININDDAIVENLEDFVVTLTEITMANGDVTLGNSTTTVSITDNDSPATITISDVTVNEAAGTATVTATIDKQVQGGVTANVVLTDGSADLTEDYTANTTSISFPGAMAGESVSIVVNIEDGMVVEDTENFTVGLDTVAGAGTIDATDTGTVTITDNDSPATITISDVTVNEAAGTATVTATIDKQVQGGVIANVLLSAGSADLTDDFTVNTTSISFPGAMAGESVDIVVNIENDVVVEDTEEFTVGLGTVSGAGTIVATDTGTVTITDNDSPATITIGDVMVNEAAGTATVTATIDKQVQGGVTANVVLTDGSADLTEDYTANTTSISFPGAIAGETVSIVVNIEDGMVVEDTENFTVGLDTVAGAGTIDATDTGTVTITDNDSPATITISDVTVNEAAGTATVTATIDKQVQGGVTANVVLTDGSADLTDDYTAETTSISFPGAMAGESVSIVVNIANDMVNEGTEDFTVGLGTVVGAGTIAATDTGTVTITDNDSATVVLTTTDATVDEGEVATYTLGLLGATSSSVDTTVNFSVGGIANLTAGSAAHQVQDYSIWIADENGDFSEVMGNQLTIPAGEPSVAIEIRTIDDVVVELTEDVSLTLTSIDLAGPDVTLGNQLTASTDILDNDTAQVIIKAVDPDATEFNETPGQFEVRLVGADGVTPAPLSFDLRVTYSIGGSATNGVIFDYADLDGDVSFGPGVTSLPINVLPQDDGVLDGDETVQLTLFSRASDTTNAPVSSVSIIEDDCDEASVTIHDNNGAVTANDDGFAIGQGGTATGNVLGDNGSGADSDVDLADATDLALPSDELTVSLVSGPSNGMLTLNADGTFSYEHDNAGSTTDSFVYLLTDSAGNTDTATVTFNIDPPVINAGPRVANVIVNSTEWFDGFRDFVDGDLNDDQSRGYVVPKGAGQTLSLPWTNVNQVLVVFDENVTNVDAGDFSFAFTPGFIGANGFADGGTIGQLPSIDASEFKYDDLTFTATIQFEAGRFFEASALQLLINSSGIQGATSGNDLDGDWTTGSSAAVSGDGNAGGDFVFEMVALPGDVDGVVKGAGQVIVDSDDSDIVRAQQNEGVFEIGGAFIASPSFNERANLDGSMLVDSDDGDIARDEQNGIVLPFTVPVIAPLMANVVSPVTSEVTTSLGSEAQVKSLTVEPKSFAIELEDEASVIQSTPSDGGEAAREEQNEIVLPSSLSTLAAQTPTIVKATATEILTDASQKASALVSEIQTASLTVEPKSSAIELEEEGSVIQSTSESAIDDVFEAIGDASTSFGALFATTDPAEQVKVSKLVLQQSTQSQAQLSGNSQELSGSQERAEELAEVDVEFANEKDDETDSFNNELDEVFASETL